MTVHTSDKTTNPYGVSVSSTEDFSRWDWGGGPRSRHISIAAAEVMLREIREHTMASLDLEENGELLVTFGIFEFETNLTVPILPLVDEWIESRAELDGKLDKTEVAAASAMADQLTEAAARLRKACPG